MKNFIIALFFKCKGCCIKPDGSPGPCAGDPVKCSDCGPPPPALDNEYLLSLLFITAVFYGIWALHNYKKNT